jgi:hypothetical protein
MLTFGLEIRTDSHKYATCKEIGITCAPIRTRTQHATCALTYIAELQGGAQFGYCVISTHLNMYHCVFGLTGEYFKIF